MLQQLLRQHIMDHKVLQLLDCIIEGSPKQPLELKYFPGDDLFTPLNRPRGIPIGNLTSQIFANLYLDSFDHQLQQETASAYLRYVDDSVPRRCTGGRSPPCSNAA
jgi:RNA-directed DNA polymerase